MTTQTSSNKVFLSYNSEDAEMVEKIAIFLDNNKNFQPWFDRWKMIPGQSAIQQLERGLKTCDACVVFMGASRQGPWQNEEVETVLRRAIKDSNFRVIPALLPGLNSPPERPSFLENKVWIDFRNGLSDEHSLYLLECGILGNEPGQGRSEPIPLTEPRPQLDPRQLINPGGASVAAGNSNLVN